MSIKQAVFEQISRTYAGAKSTEIAKVIDAAGRVLDYPETARIVTRAADVPAFVQQVIDDMWGLGSFDLRPVPSVEDVARAVVAAETKELGRPLLPSERLAAHEAASKLDDDQRIQRLADLGGKVDVPSEPEKAAPASAVPLASPSAWTQSDIEALFTARTGRTVADFRSLPASQRIEISNLYRRAADAGEPSHIGRLRSVPADKLSAADKLTLAHHDRGAPQRQRGGVATDSPAMQSIRAKQQQGIELSPAERMTAARVK
jgi:hypothetical protein